MSWVQVWCGAGSAVAPWGREGHEMSLTWSPEAGHLMEQGWPHSASLLVAPAVTASAGEKRTLLGCNSPPQISQEVCPEASSLAS